MFPQFDQQERGVHMQQDAEECWGQIVSTIGQKLRDKDGNLFIEKYFGIEVTSTWKCDEDPDEPVSYTQERMNKLQCHITSSNYSNQKPKKKKKKRENIHLHTPKKKKKKNEDVNNLSQGILEGLTEKIEKNSPKLNRLSVYTKSSKISYLPSYLTVNFVRFFWRKDTQKKAKILKVRCLQKKKKRKEKCLNS